MGHWVTLEDDQHVYISDGGKVLATRGAISSAGGGKERGRVLAERSKAAVGKARGKAKAREESYKVKAKQPIDKEGRYYPGGTTAIERDAMKRAAALREQRAAQQSPATARAIEHARAAGPSLREQADRARAAKGTMEERTQKILDRAKEKHRTIMKAALANREMMSTSRPRLERLANRTAGVVKANREERLKAQKAKWG